MKNCKVDFTKKKICVTAAYMKKAEVPFTNEFNEMSKLMRELPRFYVSVLPVKPRKKKTSAVETVDENTIDNIA